MSIINKMLRDLDKRHVPFSATGPATQGLSQHAHPVAPRALASDFFWRAMAMAMLFAVAWVAWVVWQLMPRPVVTDLAFQSQRPKVPASTVAAPAADPAPPQAAVAPPAPAAPKPEPSPSASAPKVAEAPARTSPGKANFDMLRLATELTTPIPQRRSSASRPAAKASGSKAPTRTASAQPVRAEESPVGTGRIDRRANNAAKVQAEQEFRRAVSFVNQGRVAEGMDGFRTALALDPEHEAARQTLVALLLEAKRVDEAAALLQDGLAVNPDKTAFAMLLARIMVERNQVSDALVVLQRHAAPPDRNADFHAFAAALYQRLGRHKEAIEQYEGALRIAPSAGVWWVGLGISLQASERPKEALEAYTRAKTSGRLAPELTAFVDQRLKQLQ